MDAPKHLMDRSGERPYLNGLTIAGMLLLAGSAALPWWTTIGLPEPNYVKLSRCAAFFLALVVGYVLVRSQDSVRIRFAAACSAICLPLFLLAYVSTIDAKSIHNVVEETSQAERLIRTFEETDVNPQLAWTEERKMWATPTISNDFTLVEGVESASYFVKSGWWVCLVGGTLLLLAAWSEDARAVRRAHREWMPWALALSSVVALRCLGPIAISLGYLERARYAAAHGDPASALAGYRSAAAWDKRLSYSISFHQELGRTAGRLGQNDSDYWAMIAETYATNGDLDHAYSLYRTNVTLDDSDPALSLRLSHLLLARGVSEYNSDQFPTALAQWQSAIQLDPNNVEVMYALAMGYTKVQDYHQAIFWWNRLAYSNESVGMFKSDFVASLLYRKMITSRAFSGLAWCYYRIGEDGLAVQYDAASKQQTPVALEESR